MTQRRLHAAYLMLLQIFFSSMLLPSAFEFWRGTLFWYYVFTAKNVHYSTHLELSGWPSGQWRFNQKITLGKVIYLLGIIGLTYFFHVKFQILAQCIKIWKSVFFASHKSQNNTNILLI